MMIVYRLFRTSKGYDYLINDGTWEPMLIDKYWFFETLGM